MLIHTISTGIQGAYIHILMIHCYLGSVLNMSFNSLSFLITVTLDDDDDKDLSSLSSHDTVGT